MWELFQEGWLKPEAIRLRFVGGWDSTDQECERYAAELEKRSFLRREPSDLAQLVLTRDATIQRAVGASA
jgi:hypothetical protein